MLDTYIKNRGMTKTIVHNNNHNTINETNWDADYDGNVANVSLDFTKNGRNKHLDFKFTNDDLANLLTIPSVRQPIHKRIKMDFKKPTSSFDKIFLELEPGPEPETSSLDFFEEMDLGTDNSPVLTHLSSPKSGEEFIMPFQNYTLPVYTLEQVLKPKTTTRSNSRSKKSKKSKKSSKRFSKKTSSHRVRHHNYPSTRKSPHRTI